jgi:hypothetical protein
MLLEADELRERSNSAHSRQLPQPWSLMLRALSR